MVSCNFDPQTGTRQAILSFSRDALVYDVENICYLEGCALPKGAEAPGRNLVQTPGDEGNADLITRILNLSVARMREMLYPYTKHEILQPELTDTLTAPQAYGIVLSLPRDFSQTSLNLLELLLHEYLVERAAEEWLSITLPDKMPLYRMKAERAEQEIHSVLHMRMNRLQRPAHPF